MTTDPAASPSAADPLLDAVILDCADAAGCKVAMLIARATDAARAANIEAPAQIIAQRIYALADAGRLDVTGNVRRWRAAEVRRAATP